MPPGARRFASARHGPNARFFLAPTWGLLTAALGIIDSGRLSVVELDRTLKDKRSMFKAVFGSLSVLALAGSLTVGCGDSGAGSTADTSVATDVTVDSAAVEGTGTYIYGTAVDSSIIRPTLTVPAFGSSMTATYTIQNTQADFEQIYNGGGFTISAGRLEGTLSGDTFSGYWYETAGEGGYGYIQRTCGPEREGTRVYGRFALTFSPDRRSFEGPFSQCGGDPADSGNSTWTGSLSGRGSR